MKRLYTLIACMVISIYSVSGQIAIPARKNQEARDWIEQSQRITADLSVKVSVVSEMKKELEEDLKKTKMSGKSRSDRINHINRILKKLALLLEFYKGLKKQTDALPMHVNNTDEYVVKYMSYEDSSGGKRPGYSPGSGFVALGGWLDSLISDETGKNQLVALMEESGRLHVIQREANQIEVFIKDAILLKDQLSITSDILSRSLNSSPLISKPNMPISTFQIER